jgi:glycosyltransferase involved in cell wall biosynthesis
MPKARGYALRHEPAAMETPDAFGDILCLSHLRWDFVYQRPQHLLSRAARRRRVFFWEEPMEVDGPAGLNIMQPQHNLWVVVPQVPAGWPEEARQELLRQLLDRLIAEHELTDFVLWYYTPHAILHAGHLRPAITVYDCMDELSLFRGANRALSEQERRLFQRADMVFTGGQSLYEAKQSQHRDVHLFPSSIDRAHFAQARGPQAEPEDQAGISHPRLGYFGVIDERLDLELIDGVAQAQPDWQIVLVGPLAKIDKRDLPRRPNIHYLGRKSYDQLPIYLAGWDVALMPFAHNDATRFISPTKTPEYLAGGKPVVSTSIRDVVRPYGERGLVRIADGTDEFVKAIGAALEENAAARAAWLHRVDEFIAQNSWDLTWARMEALLASHAARGETAPPQPAGKSLLQEVEAQSPSS